MAAKDPLPSSISRYKILKRLGEGGMGSLYLARDPEMDRLLAIKVLREDVESDELRERFKREARANARLNHQNIVIVYDVGEDMGRPFIAMEYIEGSTLSGLIRSREEATLDRKLLLMEQLCDGLAYAHRAGIVHRDIKPANLMLDGRGTLKILDFGIARIGHAAATGMTQAGTLMGTLNYMSPEQMTGRPVDHRTDIFAVGAVVYEFLAFQRAFPGDIQDGVLHRIIHEPPPPLEKFVPGIDKTVVQIVAKALEKDRENRYQDLDQMRADIAKFRARQLVKEDAPAVRPVTHEEGTMIVRPSTAGGSVISQPTPGPVTDPKKAELQRKRAKQIETLLDDARVALDSGDAELVYSKCESVLMLDPDNVAAVELSEKAQTLGEQAQLKTLLADARSHIAKSDFDKAMSFVGQALVIDPTSREVLAVRKEVDEAKKRKAQQDLQDQELRETIERAKKAFAQQTYETAIQYAESALEIDARSADAIEIKQKATVAVEEKRAKAKAKAEADAKAKADAEARANAEAKAKVEAKAKADAEAAEAARIAKLNETKAQEEARKRAEAEQARIAKAQEDARKKEEAERQKQADEQARAAKAKADAEAAAERKRQDAERKKKQDEEARLAKAKADEERKQQEEARKRQDAERKRKEKEDKEKEEEARRSPDVTQPMPAAQSEPGTVTLRPEAVAKAVQTGVGMKAPATYDAPAPAPVGGVEGVEGGKKGGMSPLVMGGGVAALLVVGIVGYFAFGRSNPEPPPPPVTGGSPSMTFTVTPWAHLEFTSKSDASQKATCDASPSCVVSLSPGVYNVRATNEFYRQTDFDVTVEAGKPDTVVRSLVGFDAESEVNRILAK